MIPFCRLGLLQRCPDMLRQADHHTEHRTAFQQQLLCFVFSTVQPCIASVEALPLLPWLLCLELVACTLEESHQPIEAFSPSKVLEPVLDGVEKRRCLKRFAMLWSIFPDYQCYFNCYLASLYTHCTKQYEIVAHPSRLKTRRDQNPTSKALFRFRLYT